MAIRRVFIYLGAVFLMSHIILMNNASALTTTLDMSGYGLVNSAISLKVNCRFRDAKGLNHDISNTWRCTAPDNTFGLSGIESVEQWNFNNNDIVEYDLVVYSPSFVDNLDIYTLNRLPSHGGFRTIEFRQITSNEFYSNVISIVNGTGDTLDNGTAFSTAYHIVMRHTAANNTAWTIGIPFSADYYFNFNNHLTFAIFNINQYRLTGEGSTDQKNEINATNNSVQESQTQGNSSQSDAQTGTASLVSTIGSAVSAITTASPTNCLLNGNMGNFDMGQIDLCANPVPAFVQIISSLILILITVPLCIVLFNRFIALFRSFQG